MASSLRRTGKTQFSGYLAVKAETSNWSKETTLMHFVEQSGASSVFVVSEEARKLLMKCECGRIYELEVSGRCLHNCDSVAKYGVKTPFEVVMKYICPVQLSKNAWPFRFPYEFHSWETLNQVPEGACLDLIGAALDTPMRDHNTSLAKLIVLLGNGDMQQQIELLGQHAMVTITKGDKVAISGLRMKIWNHRRTLQTNYLSVVEVNPKLEDQKLIEMFEEVSEGPKRKALRLTPTTAMTVAEIKNLGEQLLEDARSFRDRETSAFAVTGKFMTFTTDFFQQDPPILDTAKGPIMCWNTILEDDTGRLNVKVWDKACYELFHITVDKMQELWEEGNEKTASQEAILESLNTQIDVKVICLCKPEVWTYGKKEKTHKIQNNVNQLEKSCQCVWRVGSRHSCT